MLVNSTINMVDCNTRADRRIQPPAKKIFCGFEPQEFRNQTTRISPNNIIICTAIKLVVMEPNYLHFQADDPCCNTREGLDRRRHRQAETCSSWHRSPHCRADESVLASCPITAGSV